MQKGQQNRCFSLWLKTELLGNGISADASSRSFPDERVLRGEAEGRGGRGNRKRGRGGREARNGHGEGRGAGRARGR